MNTRPNFLFIFPDQWRGDCLGRLGHPVVETPHLDELAAQGVVFSKAYSACPSCIAARACTATGMTPSTTGRLGYRDRVAWRYENTLMRLLRDSGYQTMAVGKTHFYPQRAALGFEQMQLYDTQKFDPDYESDYHAWLRKETNGSIEDTSGALSSNSWVALPWLHPEYLHPNAWTAATTIATLKRRDPLRPFFMQVGFHRPHPPLDPPIDYFRMYENTELPPVPVGNWTDEFDHPVDSVDAAYGKLPKRVLERTRRAYYAQLTHIDHQIGKLIFYLRKTGQLENTYVVFTSDHGELLGDHHMFRKVSPHEGSAKIPFIVRPPKDAGCRSGAECHAPISHMDIMPTLLEAASVRIPDPVEGKSFLELLRAEDENWRAYIHGEHAANYALVGWQFVTDGKEKFLWDTQSGREWFFDLKDDPEEKIDRIDDPDYAGRIALWRRRLVKELAARPADGLSDGERLLPGKLLPHVREECLAAGTSA